MEQIEIKIKFFGGLKSYFNDSISIKINKGEQVNDIVLRLIEMNDQAQQILEISQVAIDSTIVPEDYFVNENCELIVLPPFSGG